MLDTTKIGPTQRLIIKYQSQIDSTGVVSGTTLTNIAGATRWFSANISYAAGRREYVRTITDGTPGILDFQDAYTITAALSGYYFQKTVKDLTTGTNPATAAFPGDRLHYTLLLQNFTWPPLNGITITDNLPAGLGSISNVTYPGGVSKRHAGLYHHHRPESAGGGYYKFADPDRLRCHAGLEPYERHCHFQSGEPHRNRLERHTVVRTQ
jgi:uncharacterized repeat protein (TIGR01451 family)